MFLSRYTHYSEPILNMDKIIIIRRVNIFKTSSSICTFWYFDFRVVELVLFPLWSWHSFLSKTAMFAWLQSCQVTWLEALNAVKSFLGVIFKTSGNLAFFLIAKRGLRCVTFYSVLLFDSHNILSFGGEFLYGIFE